MRFAKQNFRQCKTISVKLQTLLHKSILIISDSGGRNAIPTSSGSPELCVSIRRPNYFNDNSKTWTIMRKLFFTSIIILSTISAFTQTTTDAPIQNISTDNSVLYRLFSTKNMYTFIKLNTRNGQMWQVQWGTESKYRFETTLSEISRVNSDEEKNGRFFLYPTTNLYNFILLDQIDGRAWQVQWGKEGERMVIPIY